MDRLQSRKLWVWISWTILMIAATIITKTISDNIITWYGAVSVLYIGGQSAVDAVGKLKG